MLRKDRGVIDICSKLNSVLSEVDTLKRLTQHDAAEV
jgi:hypothetical protein